jgi:peptidoglycan/xylan/chitin deacetylase (PgdA/CDA1 family)
MYHKVSANGYSDYLTVPAQQLEAQFQYLQQEGYTPILLSDLVNYVRQAKPLPPKPVLITFDDGYRDNYTIMYPLLKKYGMKAGIFIVPTFLQTELHTYNEKQQGNAYLQLNDIMAMDRQLVEYGLHSYDHKNYKTLTPQQLDQDIARTRAMLFTLNIPFQPCLAFPYGAYPKRAPVKQRLFFNTLVDNNIALAFRIGNRLNPLPLRNPLLIQRLDIRGDDPFSRFVHLIKKGKNRF